MALFAVLATQAPNGISADEYRMRLPEGFAYHQALRDKGIIRHSWVRVGAAGGLNIYDVGSHEELLAALYDNPLSPHQHFEVYPLADPASFNSTAFAEGPGSTEEGPGDGAG